jgi:hypothetical protein
MFSADTRGNNEDKKRRGPGTIFGPEEGQETLRLFLMGEEIVTS